MYGSPTILAADSCFLATTARLLGPIKSLLGIHPGRTVPAAIAGHPPVLLLPLETLNEHRIAS